MATRPSQSSSQQMCQVCHENLFKYRCPCCSTLSCTAACVKQHKLDTLCSGIRPPSEFVSLKEMNDITLIRDFSLLEAAQNLVTRPSHNPLSLSVSQKRAALKKLCYDRGIWLKTLPCVFVKAKCNSSHVRRKDQLWWRVAWHFPSIEANPAAASSSNKHLVLVDSYVDETVPLSSLVARFFEDTWKVDSVKHRLTALQGRTLQLRLATDPDNALDGDLGLKELLKGKNVIEFPEILVQAAEI